MSYEEAMFYKIMLQSGNREIYETWIDNKLNTEESFNEETVDLAFLRDINDIISYLHNYVLDKYVDENIVFEYIWTVINKNYTDNTWTREETVQRMYRIWSVIKDEEYSYEEPWYTMFLLDDLYEEASYGYVSKQSVNKVFEKFVLRKEVLTNKESQSRH